MVGTEGSGVGIFEGSRLCRFLLFYNPQTPFEGGFGRWRSYVPKFLRLALGFVCRWSLNVTLSSPDLRSDEVIPDLIGNLRDLRSIKIKPMAVDFPLGVWLAGWWWFYL